MPVDECLPSCQLSDACACSGSGSDLASGADFTVRAGDWDFVASGAFAVAKQCMTVVDTDRLQSVAEALRCRHDDGSDGGTWRVKIGPRNARFLASTDFLGE